MSNLKESLKEARFRRKERFYWSLFILVTPPLFFLMIVSLMLYNDPVEAFLHLDKLILWIPEFSIHGIRFGTIPAGFFNTSFYWYLGPTFFLITILVYLFYFGKRSKGGLTADMMTFLQNTVIKGFFGISQGETGMNYFGSFGSKERVMEGLIYKRLKKVDGLIRAKTLRFFAGEYSPDVILDQKGKNDLTTYVKRYFKKGKYIDLFQIIEGYLFENISPDNVCDEPLNEFKSFDDNTRKVKVSRRALKDYIALHIEIVERIFDYGADSLELFSTMEEHGEIGLFDNRREDFIAYSAFYAFYRYMNFYVGIPAGIVTARLEDYELRRIIDIEETVMRQKMTISLKKINDGSSKSKVDDRLPRAFFIFWQYVYNDSSERERFEDLNDTLDPLSQSTSEKLGQKLNRLEMDFSKVDQMYSNFDFMADPKYSDEELDEKYAKGESLS